MNCLQEPHYILYIRENEEEKNFEKSQRKKAQRTKSHSITHANFFMHDREIVPLDITLDSPPPTGL